MNRTTPLPHPAPEHRGGELTEPKGEGAFSWIARLWRPSNASEEVASTVSRFAMRLIDLATGKAYSADEMIDAVQQQAYAGVPANYVAEVAATASSGTATASPGNTLQILARTLGDTTTTLKILDPSESEFTLAVYDPGDLVGAVPVPDGEVHVYLGTGVGDAGTATIPTTESGTIEVLLDVPGVAAADASIINIFLPDSTSPLGDSFVTPSSTIDFNESSGTYSVSLATDAGEVATLVLSESVLVGAGGGGEVTISQTAAYAGEWGNGHVNAYVHTGVGESLSPDCTATADPQAGLIEIVLTLGTTSEGLVDALSDDDAATIINAALVLAGLDAALVAASSTAGNFVSYQDAVAMGATGGGTDGVNAAPDDAENLASAFETGLEALAGIASVTVSTGTDTVAIPLTIPFLGAGANYTFSTLAQVKAILIANSTVLTGGTITGVGTTAFTAGQSDITVESGTDVVPAIPGTPAKLGRLAIDVTGNDVWTAMKDDNTTTQDGWVRIFNGS